MYKAFFLIVLCALVNLTSMAQCHISTFLTDFGVKDFKMNSTLNQLKSIKYLNNDPFSIAKEPENGFCIATKKTGHFWGNTIFDSAFFLWEDGKLICVGFFKKGKPNKEAFYKEYDLIRSKYGEAIKSPYNGIVNERREWNEKGLELVLIPGEKEYSLMLSFGNKQPKEGVKKKQLFTFK